jgi:nitronate monooxygenase
VLAAQVAGADFAYVGSAFLSTHEANVVDDYKQMIVDSNSADIVYSNLFTGVHGNYLRGSIAAHGMDPDGLPESDPAAMNFGTEAAAGPKQWKDIWGSGQGIGAVSQRQSVAELVETLRVQYEEALANPTRLGRRPSFA